MYKIKNTIDCFIILIFTLLFFSGGNIQITKAVYNYYLSVGTQPWHSNLVGSNLYVLNNGSGNVSVINTANNTVTNTISVENAPSTSTIVGSSLYVNNLNSNTVSVINTTNNTVTNTISVGTSPIYSTLVGTNLYVLNSGSANVSVIDTTNNTVTNTISVDTGPKFSVLSGTKLFVLNYTAGTISVINTANNTIIYTIPGLNSPQFATLVGDSLYVFNYQINSAYIFSVIDYVGMGTISIGSNPVSAILSGNYLYVINSGSSNISVINTTNNTVTNTISVSPNPSLGVITDNYLYLINEGFSNVSIIDVLNPFSPISPIAVGSNTKFLTLVGTKLYVLNSGSNNVSIIDTVTKTIIDISPPVLVSAVALDNTVTLTYDKSIDSSHIPLYSSFLVNVNLVPVTVSNVSISGSTVILTLVSSVLPANSIYVSYFVNNPLTDPNPIQDLYGNMAEAFSFYAGSNSTIFPTTTITSPTNNSSSSSTTVNLTGTSFDTNLFSTTISIDNGTFVATSGTASAWTYSASGLLVGSHTFQSKATDMVNGTGLSSVVNFNVFGTGPGANSFFPTPLNSLPKEVNKIEVRKQSVVAPIPKPKSFIPPPKIVLTKKDLIINLQVFLRDQNIALSKKVKPDGIFGSTTKKALSQWEDVTNDKAKILFSKEMQDLIKNLSTKKTTFSR